jgi:hypothetical protein
MNNDHNNNWVTGAGLDFLSWSGVFLGHRDGAAFGVRVRRWADMVKCAEQIDTNYVYSWRPNPTDQVCTKWDEWRIRKILREGITASRGCRRHIHRKDTETLQVDPTRLARWLTIARDVTEDL